MNSDFTLNFFSKHKKQTNAHLSIPDPDLFASLPLDEEFLESPDERSVAYILSFSASYNIEKSSQMGTIEQYRN